MADYKKHEAKQWAREKMHGHWTTNITPFSPDGELDEAGIKKNVEHQLKLGIQGMGITWLTGEFWSLTTAERKRICELTVRSVNRKVLVAVHTAHSSIKECIDLTKHAEEAGADLAVMMPPYMIARTPGQVYEFFRQVAQKTNLGIAVFNSPQSGITLKPKDIAELTEIPNICAVKVATRNVADVIATHKAAGDKVVVSAALEDAFFYQDFHGFRQQVLFANACDWMFDTPEHSNYVRFVNHACRGEMQEAAEIYRSKVHPLKQVYDGWGSYLRDKYNSAYPSQMAKTWAALIGFAAGPVRAPLMPLSDQEREKLTKDIFEARRKAGIDAPLIPGAL